MEKKIATSCAIISTVIFIANVLYIKIYIISIFAFLLLTVPAIIYRTKIIISIRYPSVKELIQGQKGDFLILIAIIIFGVQVVFESPTFAPSPLIAILASIGVMVKNKKHKK